jgi:general secretion pathway protein I
MIKKRNVTAAGFSGFTLIEILIAMLILAGGILLLSNSWSGSFMRIKKTQINTEMAALLERKMVELDILYRNKPLESIPESGGDDFGSEYSQYSWTFTSKEFEFPDLSASLTSRDGGANNQLIMVLKLLTDHLKKTVKEMKVTVIYNAGNGRKVEASVTTLFVDYNKEPPLPGAI